MHMAHITVSEASYLTLLVITGMALSILISSRIREWLKQN